MNKLKVSITGLLIACLGIGVVNAQTGTATTTPVAKAPAKASTKKANTAKASTGAKTAAKPAAGASAAKPAQHLKKDGTPDKRYKENKTA